MPIPEGATPAARIFYDDALDVEEKRRRLIVLADNAKDGAAGGDARGYLSSIAMQSALDDELSMEAEPRQRDRPTEDRAEANGEQAVVDALTEVAYRMTTITVQRVGSLRAVRERHLTKDLKACLEARTGKTVSSSMVPIPEWPSRGAVDIVVPEHSDPRHPGTSWS